jgi:membrane protein DedA with SNARE-associated domain
VIGYAFGNAVQQVLGAVRDYEKHALIGLALLGCLIGLVHWLRHTRVRQRGR